VSTQINSQKNGLLRLALLAEVSGQIHCLLVARRVASESAAISADEPSFSTCGRMF
jgi:hypothetical protein